MYIFIFIHSFLYFGSALIGLLFEFLLYEIIRNIINHLIIGIFFYSSINILDNYFYNNNNNENKYKEDNFKYYFGYFFVGFILYIILFLYI